jgi:hypothetical protein
MYIRAPELTTDQVLQAFFGQEFLRALLRQT